MFWDVGCSLLRFIGFSTSLHMPHALGNIWCNFWWKNFFSTVQFVVVKSPDLDPGPFWPKMLILDLHCNYLCTYDLYGPVRNVFDAGRYIMWIWNQLSLDGFRNTEFYFSLRCSDAACSSEEINTCWVGNIIDLFSRSQGWGAYLRYCEHPRPMIWVIWLSIFYRCTVRARIREAAKAGYPPAMIQTFPLWRQSCARI